MTENESIAEKHNISLSQYENFCDFENIIDSEAYKALAKCYNFSNIESDAAIDFVSQTTIYKLLALIHDIAYFKFVLNRKHAYEDNKFMYCQDCDINK